MLLEGWWHKLSDDGRRRALRLLAHAVLIALMVGGTCYGLRRAEQYVRSMDRYQGPIEVVLRDRHRVGDVLVALDDIPDTRIGRGSRARVTEVAPDGRLHVESIGPRVWISAYDEAVPGSGHQVDDVLVTRSDIANPRILAGSQVVVRDTDRTGRLLLEQQPEPAWVGPGQVRAEWLTRFDYVREQLQREAVIAVRGGVLDPEEGRPPDWFDPTTPGRVAERLADKPYVARVVQVDKQLLAGPDGGDQFVRRIVVSLDLRRPLAQVWHDSGGIPRVYLLDGECVVLEARDQAVDLPQISNCRPSRARPEPGQKLELPDVQAGLGLLSELSAQPFFGEVRAVDVDNYDRRRNPRRSELVLLVDPPPGDPSTPVQEVLWGVRIGSPAYHVEYNDARTKVEILYSIWKKFGTLNLGQGPYDLYSDKDQARWSPSVQGDAGFSFRTGN